MSIIGSVYFIRIEILRICKMYSVKLNYMLENLISIILKVDDMDM